MRISKTACGIIVMLVVAAIGTSLALQGWKSRTPFFDRLLPTDGAHEFVVHKRIPDRGSLSSYASHNPPGAAWLMAPGVLLLTDPRLFQYIGSTIIYLGTLLGVFLLSHMAFGIRCAILAVALYGLSELGLYVAGSLWERFPPHFFYVWMVYWAVQWVNQRKVRYLTAALVTWVLGMYVFMEIAPAILILPAVWLIYRPPVKLQPLLVVGLLALIIWFPYLRFQYTRNFVDLRSLVLRQTLLPVDYKNSWCDSGSILLSVDDISRTLDFQPDKNLSATANVWTTVWSRVESVLIGLVSNFNHSVQIPGTGIFLLSLVVVSLLAVGVSGRSTTLKVIEHSFWHYWFTRFVIGMILFGALANELLIVRYLTPDGVVHPSTISKIRWLQAVLVVSGLSLLVIKGRLLTIMKRLVIRMELTAQTARHTKNLRLLVLSLLIPWLILLVMVEADRTERFWWLWPLQVVFLAASVTYLPARWSAAPSVAWIGSLGLLLALLANPVLLSRTKAWIRDGWSGIDAEQIKVMDYVARQIKSEGKDRAAVGYQIFIKRFMARFNVANPSYKVGAELDLLLKYPHGIMNTNHCAEGISSQDEYRIVQTSRANEMDRNHIIVVSPDDPFHILQKFESYQVFKRH